MCVWGVGGQGCMWTWTVCGLQIVQEFSLVRVGNVCECGAVAGVHVDMDCLQSIDT